MNSKNLSRRDFLKGALAGTATVALASATGITAFAEEKGIYTPGTYSATAQGMGTVTVTMTFDANSITDVVVDVSEETPTIGALYGEDLAAAIKAAQGAEFDAISGATITSTAAKKAADACIAQAKGAAVELGGVEAAGDYEIPAELTKEEIEGSKAELWAITPDEVKEYDVVVVGAGAAGVPAAGVAAEGGASVALLQKEAIVVSQGNCASAIIKEKSTPAGIQKWVHHTNSLNNWRSNEKLLRAYAEHSEEALLWYWNRAGLTTETEYGDGSKIDSNTDCANLLNDGKGLFAYMSTSQDLTGVWQDRQDTYDYGDDHCYFMAPWIGPKPQNVGNVLQNVLNNVMEKCPNLEVFYQTPGVQLVKDGDKVTGVIAKDVDGKYIQFNAKKAVILATGDYMNNDAMVARWCPDTFDFDKKQYHKTGDGHVMAIAAGAKMEPLGHTKMMHDFDSAQMYEEPFLYVNMNGERFTNEYTGFVYMGNVIKFQPKFNGSNVDANHPDGSKGWYCQIYDSSYEEWPAEDFVSRSYPADKMMNYVPSDGEHPGVFVNLIDAHKCDTLEELAKELDIPYDTFKATVDRYNELCESGEDTDFGKPTKYMKPILKAPFWGLRKHIRVSSIDSGVMTNEYAQALDADGKVIEGLYCVGNLGGPFYGGADYPFHQTGLSLGRCYTFGMIAAKHAVGK